MAVQKGYFLIADITGYTQYLSETELDHAQNILSALLNLLIEHTRPPLIISRLAGDAVISYGLAAGFVTGQTFVDMLGDTYISFRRAIELMVRNTTCPCNACRNIGSLDLKFFVHYGEFAVQKLDAHEELVGSDVNLLHRLLKNHVTEATGLKAYTLYSAAAIERLGLAEDVPHMSRLTETYEHLAPVEIFVEDMHPLWESKRHEARVVVTPEKALINATVDIDMPREHLWGYLAQPEHFNALTGNRSMAIANRRGARTGQGTVYQCFHNDGGILPLLVVEWQPFERMVTQFDVPMPIKGAVALTELRFEEIPGGTRLSQIVSKAEGPLAARLAADMGMRTMAKKFEDDMIRFKQHIEAAWAADRAPQPPRTQISTEAVRAAARDSLVAA